MNKKQIGETVYGKNAKAWAEKRMREMRIQGVAPEAPWYGFWVEELPTGGWGVFVSV